MSRTHLSHRTNTVMLNLMVAGAIQPEKGTGFETLTAPATVNGKRPDTMPLVNKDWEGSGSQAAVSQETCHHYETAGSSAPTDRRVGGKEKEMHIEPGVVDGAKMVLACGTAAAAAGYTLKLTSDDLKTHSLASFVVRSVIAAIGVFIFFELMPHYAVGISEVHFILGTTLFLLLGAGPAAMGLAAGLAIQGTFFAPSDLPMYFVNVSTLLFPLFAVTALAKRIVPEATAYVDLDYKQVLKMSAVYQGGVVAWVAFWAIYGQGVGAENMASIATFGAAYMLVILVEPIADLAVLAAAKTLRGAKTGGLFTNRLLNAA